MAVLELKISQKSFKNDTGENVNYVAYETELNGKTFSLYPKEADKKLLNYMLEQEGLLNVDGAGDDGDDE